MMTRRFKAACSCSPRIRCGRARVRQGDGGHADEGLAGLGGIERPGGGAEEVGGADDLLAQPHRQRLYRGEPRPDGRWRRTAYTLGLARRPAGPRAPMRPYRTPAKHADRVASLPDGRTPGGGMTVRHLYPPFSA